MCRSRESSASVADHSLSGEAYASDVGVGSRGPRQPPASRADGTGRIVSVNVGVSSWIAGGSMRVAPHPRGAIHWGRLDILPRLKSWAFSSNLCKLHEPGGPVRGSHRGPSNSIRTVSRFASARTPQRTTDVLRVARIEGQLQVERGAGIGNQSATKSDGPKAHGGSGGW
jgi:hypothetical protein